MIQKHDSNDNENYQLERGIVMNRRFSIDSENSHQPISEHSECTADARFVIFKLFPINEVFSSSIISVDNTAVEVEHHNGFETIPPDTMINTAKVKNNY